jgi:hypothetical protein
MHVTVDLAHQPPEVTLVEPDDCRRFDVVVRGAGTAADLDRVLTGASVGHMEGDEALVTVAAVRRLASESVGEQWEADFTSMLEFARGRSWLTDDGLAIRAHVQWQ